MSTYVVGDIQGCLKPLQCLLKAVHFNPKKDQLWSVGDVVNRGPDSLETLRFLKSLGSAFRMVLGNHDLHLIALFYGIRKPTSKDTLQEILDAPDSGCLIHWLRSQPLLLQQDNHILVHAGIPAIWSIPQVLNLAREVESILHSDDPMPFLKNMYGNEPACWSDDLKGTERLRVITNYLTRMRCCTADGTLNLDFKGAIRDIPEGYAPWFSYSRANAYPKPEQKQNTILFGHWAALDIKKDMENCHESAHATALDSGCVWGNKLTFYRLKDGKRFFCDCVDL